MTWLGEWLLVLYWVFYKPSGLYAHIRSLSPHPPPNANVWRLWQDVPTLRPFLLRLLRFTVYTPILVNVCVGLASDQVAWLGQFNWTTMWWITLFLVAAGVVFGVARGLVFGVALAVAGGVVLGVAGGVALSVAGGVAVVLLTVSAVVAPVGVAMAAAVLMLFGVDYVVNLVTRGAVPVLRADSVALGVVILLRSLRLPAYILNLLVWMLKRKASGASAAIQRLQASPVLWDEFLVLPQPRLHHLLRDVLDHSDPASALHQLQIIAFNPYQHWAIQRALRAWLSTRALEHLVDILSHSQSYPPRSESLRQIRYSQDTTLGPRLLLSAFIGQAAAFEHGAPPNLAEHLAAWLTKPLFARGEHPAQHIAKTWHDLLNDAGLPLTAKTLQPFKAALSIEHGSEVYASWCNLAKALQCYNLSDIADCTSILNSGDFANPLRPALVKAFRLMANVASEIKTFAASDRPLRLPNTLLQSQAWLLEVEELAAQVHEPERGRLLMAVKIWQDLIAETSGRVVTLGKTSVLDNPFLAGRKLNPHNDAKRFVGRRDVIRAIANHVKNNSSLFLHGQRRIGKSSILLFLHTHFQSEHNLLPIYVDLQTKPQSAAGLCKLLINSTQNSLSKAGWVAPTPPTDSELAAEPYITTDDYFHRVLQGQAPQRRIVIALDEFEELEAMVKEKKISDDAFSFLRSLSQQVPIIFTGLHTIEDMRSSYLHPFFQAAPALQVHPLDYGDVETLMRDPADGFPRWCKIEAIQRVWDLAGGHPFLTQDLCHNLVNHLNSLPAPRPLATTSHVDAVITNTLQTSSYYFSDYVWNRASPAEQTAMGLIAKNHASSDPKAIDLLIKRGILVADGVGYRFSNQLTQMWVAQLGQNARP